MAARKSFFYLQQVTYQQLNAAFDGLEQADWNAVVDQSAYGVRSGAAVTAHGPNNLTVDVSGPGVAYDKTGARIAIPSTQNVDCSVDHLGVTTAVSGGSNSKILSIFAFFARNAQTPLTDGNGATVFFDQNESFALRVYQGAEALSPTAPGLDAAAVLLADVTIAFGTSAITGGMISTTRREDTFVATQGVIAVRRGKVKDAVADLVTYLGQHIAGSGSRQAAGTIDYGGGGSWAGGTSPTNPATDVETQLDKILSDLSSTSTGASGAHRLGCAAGTTWLGGRTRAAGNLFAVVDQIAIDLAATTSSDDGCERIGAATRSSSPDSLSSGDAGSQLAALLGFVNNRARLASAETVSGAWTFSTAPTLSGTLKYGLTSRTITRFVNEHPIWNATTDFGLVVGTATIVQNTTNGGSQVVFWPLCVPNGCVLQTVTLELIGAAGHAALPSAMPILKVFRVDVTGTATQVATQTDGSVSTAAYQANHTIVIPSMGEAVDKTANRYYARVDGEGGTNFVTGLKLLSVQWTATVTSQDDGAS